MNRITSLFAAGAFALSFAACQNSDAEKHAAAAQQQQRTIDSMKMEIAKQRVIDSMQEVAQYDKEQAVANTAAATAAASRRRTTTRRSSSYSSNNNSGYSSATTSNAAYDPTPVAPAKRGWSAKAKGAVIGAGAGAIGGAIINKRNRAVGALIGGAGGAAVGTGIGAIIDRKNGR